MTEPSSILRNPMASAPSVSFSGLDSIDASFAKTVLECIVKIIAAKIIE